MFAKNLIILLKVFLGVILLKNRIKHCQIISYILWLHVHGVVLVAAIIEIKWYGFVTLPRLKFIFKAYNMWSMVPLLHLFSSYLFARKFNICVKLTM